MKFLEFLECVHDVFVLGETLRHLAEFLLGLKILLEVEIAQIPVYLDFIVELLDIELICVIDVAEMLYRNRADSAPSCLQLTEGRECCPEIFLVLHQRL